MTKITRDNISTISQRWEKKSIVVKQSLQEECSKIFFREKFDKEKWKNPNIRGRNLLLHF